MEFVCIFEILYDEKSIKFNVHTLKHLVQCVRYCGPLWAASTFPFENAIFYLKQCVHGPKGVYEQMTKKTLQANFFKSLVTEVVEAPNVKAFCDSLFSRKEVACFHRIGDVVLIGKGTLDPASTIDAGVEVLSFDRCISSGMVIHSEYYTKAQKSKDSVFRLENECFVNVIKLLKYGDTAYAEVEFLNVKCSSV